MERIRAVIFDLDGLMVHSEHHSYKAWKRLMGEFGYSLDDDEYRTVIGVDGETTVNLFRQGRDLPMSNEELIDLHYRYWISIMMKEVQPIDGLFDLVKSVQARNLKMGIASNSRSDYVHNILETIGLNGDFSCIVASDQVDKGKPAPDVYLAVSNCLGVRPVECLALEDSPTGLQSALNAGMRCVVVPNPDLIHERFEGAFAQFPSLEDLIPELDQVLC
jgi:putative hydrolase of the HAD superfamily